MGWLCLEHQGAVSFYWQQPLHGLVLMATASEAGSYGSRSQLTACECYSSLLCLLPYQKSYGVKGYTLTVSSASH